MEYYCPILRCYLQIRRRDREYGSWSWSFFKIFDFSWCNDLHLRKFSTPSLMFARCVGGGGWPAGGWLDIWEILLLSHTWGPFLYNVILFKLSLCHIWAPTLTSSFYPARLSSMGVIFYGSCPLDLYSTNETKIPYMLMGSQLNGSCMWRQRSEAPYRCEWNLCAC